MEDKDLFGASLTLSEIALATFIAVTAIPVLKLPVAFLVILRISTFLFLTSSLSMFLTCVGVPRPGKNVIDVTIKDLAIALRNLRLTQWLVLGGILTLITAFAILSTNLVT
jgi:hypothetical protein